MRLLVRLIVLVGIAAAGARASIAETVAIESHVGGRAKGSAEILAPLYEELGRREVLHGYAKVGRRFEAGVSAPSLVGNGLPEDFAEQVERGYRLWTSGKFQESIAAVQPLVVEAHRNSGAVASNPKLGAAVFKSLVTLALCHHRLGQEAASWEAMAELLRSFETEVSKAVYGAEAYEIFTRVRGEARASVLGGLTVRATDEKAAIFINERFLKLGEVVRTDLIPGRYRVFAQLGKAQGRLYSVEVKAGARSQLELDPSFEGNVVTSPEWSGLSFADRSEREKREVELAARFGAAIDVMGVIVVGIDERNQRSVVYGALINSVTKKELRRASVVLDSLPPPERLRALARFLTGDQPVAGIEVYQTPQALSGDESTRRFADRHGHWQGWKWAAGGGAVVGVGTGVALLALDGNCSSDAATGKVCPDVYDTKVAGFVALGAGVALGAVATWLWLGDRASEKRSTSFWMAPTNDGLFAVLRGSL
jgi:hypothetical protein